MERIPTDEEIRYEIAAKRVKDLKGFYTHLAVYIVINIIILIGNQHWNESGNFFQLKNFSTAIFWGIGLVAHGLNVFGLGLFFSKKWEEKKIKEIMDKDKKRNQNWE
jgi:hypothetical protein